MLLESLLEEVTKARDFKVYKINDLILIDQKVYIC